MILGQLMKYYFPFRFLDSLMIMNLMKKCLPLAVFNALLHPTFYRQFVAGNDVKTITTTTTRLAERGIRPMVAVPIEVGFRVSE